MNAPVTTPQHIAIEARQCLIEWEADARWPQLRAAALTHLRRWTTMTGLPVITRLNLATDAEPLLDEAARALAIKAAAHITTADDLADMLPFAVPVEEAVLAFTAQVSPLRAITDRAGVRIIQRTHTRPLVYRAGCLTHTVYAAAWGEPPARYWLPHQVIKARQAHLDSLYSNIGLAGGHELDFTTAT